MLNQQKKPYMKNLILISLLSSIFLFGYSQENRVVKVLGTFAAWSIMNGIGDGLNDSGHKTLGHSFNAASAAALAGGILWSQPDKKDWFDYFVIGAGVRYVTFDVSYNLTRDLPYDYIGTTAGTDRLLNKVPAGFRTYTKGLVLCFSISYTFNSFGKKHRNKTFDYGAHFK
jgi:hypothetical protein